MPRTIFWYLFRNTICSFSQYLNVEIQLYAALYDRRVLESLLYIS